MTQQRHRVLIVGSGFGGLFAARRLKGAPVDVTVIDRTTHHLFQPLLYQVATGILSEGEIAPPMRDVLRRQKNARVVFGEVTDLDLAARTVTSHALGQETVTPYDSLIFAAGMRTSYFGNDAFAEHAPGLKSVDDALHLRARIFGAFEMAETAEDPDERRAWMTFVVVGGGATGVEMAGQIAELSRRTLTSNFRSIDPSDARIVLVDAVEQILGTYGGKLPEKAAAHLTRSGVELLMGTKVVGVDAAGIDLEGPGPDRIEARTKVWGAGVEGVPLVHVLAERAGVAATRKGQLPVGADCTLAGHPEVFVVGDLALLPTPLPGVAEVAMQTGRHAASEIRRRVAGNATPRPFKYLDLGNMASVSRHFAVVERGPIRISGFVGWLAWLVVHLTFLTGFKNRVSALAHWIVSFVGSGRSERVFSADELEAARNGAPVG